jgi:hypothetical protein
VAILLDFLGFKKKLGIFLFYFFESIEFVAKKSNFLAKVQNFTQNKKRLDKNFYFWGLK